MEFCDTTSLKELRRGGLSGARTNLVGEPISMGNSLVGHLRSKVYQSFGKTVMPLSPNIISPILLAFHTVGHTISPVAELSCFAITSGSYLSS